MHVHYLVLIGITFLALSGCGSRTARSVEDVVLRTPDGSPVRYEPILTRSGAKATLVNFWSLSCPPCRAELPVLAKLYEKHRNEGFEIIAVNGMDAPEEVAKFLKSSPLPFPVVCNGEGRNDLMKKYGVVAFPTNLIFDANGKLVERLDGYEEFALRRALRKVGVGSPGQSPESGK